MARLEAKIDQLHDAIYGGPNGLEPFESRLIALETFQRETRIVLYGDNPAKNEGIINQVKDRTFNRITIVVTAVVSLATALNMLFGDSIRRHFRDIGQKAPIVYVPEEQGQPWR